MSKITLKFSSEEEAREYEITEEQAEKVRLFFDGLNEKKKEIKDKLKDSELVKLLQAIIAVDLNAVLRDMNKTIGLLAESENDDDVEWFGYFEELDEIFTILADKNNRLDRKKLSTFIYNLEWGNFFNDDEGEHYSLGSMYYNKLTWITEGCEIAEVRHFANNLLDFVPELLNKVEDYATK